MKKKTWVSVKKPRRSLVGVKQKGRGGSKGVPGGKNLDKGNGDEKLRHWER